MSEQQGYESSVYRQIQNHNNGLSLRLDTQELLERARMNLSGIDIVPVQLDDGSFTSIPQKVCDPIANDKGIHRIMGWYSSMLNPHTIQGNSSDELLGNYLGDAREEIAFDLVINLGKFGLNRKDVGAAINQCMLTSRLVATRTLENKERESLIPTVRHVESNTNVVRDESQRKADPYFGRQG